MSYSSSESTWYSSDSSDTDEDDSIDQRKLEEPCKRKKPRNIGLALYAIVQFVALILLLAGISIDMYRPRYNDPALSGSCLTLWGVKDKCSSTALAAKTNVLWADCPRIRKDFNSAGVCAIVSVVLFGVGMFFSLVRLCCCGCCTTWFCLMLNLAGFATTAATWLVASKPYYEQETPWGPECGKLRIVFKFGSGFALFLTAWILDIINIFILICT